MVEKQDWLNALFQFTPLREGRHQQDFHVCICKRISIHAPPRGATHPRETFPASRLFQFTPLREGRRHVSSFVPLHSDFNSRPSARGDLLWLSDNVSPANFNSRPSARGDNEATARTEPGVISIHAPPRGATTAKPQGLGAFQFQFTPLREGRRVSFASRKPVSPNFNSRPSARGDPIPAHGDSTFPFQFTPLREGRRVTRSPTPQAANFNSRPSARGDLMPFRHFPCLSISIHAPPRGAT